MIMNVYINNHNNNIVIKVLSIMGKSGSEYIKVIASIIKDGKKLDLMETHYLKFASWIRNRIIKDPRQLYILWKRYKEENGL